MSIVSDVAGAAVGTAGRSLLPWFLLAAVLALGSAGAAGMYGGYEIATARHAKEREALQQAQLEALKAKNEALAQANKRGDDAAINFLAALRDMRVINTTINKEVEREVEKLVYTDCNLPDSGVDLLQKHVDEVNMRLLGGNKK